MSNQSLDVQSHRILGQLKYDDGLALVIGVSCASQESWLDHRCSHEEIEFSLPFKPNSTLRSRYIGAPSGSAYTDVRQGHGSTAI